jgi:hypothetical protein
MTSSAGPASEGRTAAPAPDGRPEGGPTGTKRGEKTNRREERKRTERREKRTVICRPPGFMTQDFVLKAFHNKRDDPSSHSMLRLDSCDKVCSSESPTLTSTHITHRCLASLYRRTHVHAHIPLPLDPLVSSSVSQSDSPASESDWKPSPGAPSEGPALSSYGSITVERAIHGPPRHAHGKPAPWWAHTQTC